MNEYKLRDSNDSQWWINRSGGINVNSEWESASSWSGTRKIFPKTIARIYIHGIYKGDSFGCKPKSWSGDLDINNKTFAISTTHRSCKSIPDAIHYLERELTDRFIINCLTRFYKQENAMCISRLDKDGAPIPLATTFWKQDWMKLSCGIYVYVGPLSYLGIQKSCIERFPFGYSGYGYEGDTPQWVDYERINTQRN